MNNLAGLSELYTGFDLNIQFTNDIADLSRREADVSLSVADDVVGRKLAQIKAGRNEFGGSGTVKLFKW